MYAIAMRVFWSENESAKRIEMQGNERGGCMLVLCGREEGI